MLGGDRPAVRGGQPRDRGVRGQIRWVRPEHVHMQVPHADVTEDNQGRRCGAAGCPHDFIKLRPERRQLPGRDRHVDLVRDPRRCDRLGQPLSISPERGLVGPVHGEHGLWRQIGPREPFRIKSSSGGTRYLGQLSEQVTGDRGGQRPREPSRPADRLKPGRVEVLGGQQAGTQPAVKLGGLRDPGDAGEQYGGLLAQPATAAAGPR